MYPNYYSSGAPYQQRPNCLNGRQVSSYEEARAAQIDFDGSLFVFPDVVNKKIYTKQIGVNGNLEMKMYAEVAMKDPTPNYVTKDELNEAISSIKEELAKPKDLQSAKPQLNF